MRKLAIVMGLSAVLAVLSGCYVAPVKPPVGLAFSDVGAPLSTEFNETTPVPTKHGCASAASVLGLVAYGDCSLATAAAQGHLSRVHYADYSFFNVLGIYQRFTTTVHGE